MIIMLVKCVLLIVGIAWISEGNANDHFWQTFIGGCLIGVFVAMGG